MDSMFVDLKKYRVEYHLNLLVLACFEVSTVTTMGSKEPSSCDNRLFAVPIATGWLLN